MSEEMGPGFQLRRTGKPATVVGVKDLLRLEKDVLRFGRHSGNNFYLDSATYPCIISRWHCEIHRVEQEGRTRYILRDNSLNGTYVNDVRVKGNHLLREGDMVIFGHVNGKNIQPGQLSLQSNSEFVFRFEQGAKPREAVELVNDSQESEVGLSSCHIVNIPDGCSVAVPSVAVPTITPDPHTPQRITSSQETPGEVGKAAASRRCLIPETSGAVVLRDISNSPKCRGSRLVSLDQLISDKLPTKPKVEEDINIDTIDSNPDDSVIREAVLTAENFGASDSDEDIFDLGSDVKVKVERLEAPLVKLEPILPNNLKTPGTVFDPMPKLKPVPPVTRVTTLPEVTPPAEVAGTSGLSITVGQLHSAAAPSATSAISQIHSGAMAKTIPTVPSFGGFSDNGLTHKLNMQAPRSRQNFAPASRGKYGPKSRGAASNRGKRIPEKAPPTFSTQRGGKKRKRGKNWTRGRGRGRPAKRSRSTLSRASMELDEDDEEYRYHYDSDKCSSYDCVQPLDSQVNWVQCDDCDGWYHTVCAGCNYDDVKHGNTEFHCGCV